MNMKSSRASSRPKPTPRPKLVGDKDRLIPPELRAKVLAHVEGQFERYVDKHVWRRAAVVDDTRLAALAGNARRWLVCYFALQLADLAGLRISEVVKLQGRDCDVERAPYRLFIRGAKHRVATHVDEQPIGDELASLLRKWLAGPGKTRTRHAWYVVGWRAKPLSRQWVLHLVKELHQACGVPAIYNFHSWRHGYGTRIYQATKDLVFTSRMLRHRSVKPTERYIHMATAADELDKVMAAIAKRPDVPAVSTDSPRRPRARKGRR